VHLEKVENDRECNIFFKALHKSFEVPCGHKFCLRYILHWAMTQHKAKLIKTCLLCRKKIEGAIFSIQAKFVIHLHSTNLQRSLDEIEDFERELSRFYNDLYSYKHILLKIIISCENQSNIINGCLYNF
jgi:hypothetical protein